MADLKQSTPASSALTITLASLASDTNLVAGRQSTVIDNASNLYLDYMIGGKITVGTSPTADRYIEVWTFCNVDDTPTYPDTFGGTDAARTLTSADIKASCCKLVAAMKVSNTSDRTYWFAGVSLKQLFGGNIPDKVGIFVVHNTGVALNATGSNHAISVVPVYRTVT